METLQNQNVLLFTRTMGLGGTENVVLQLCEILKPVVKKVVVCSCGGINEKKLEIMGIQHYTIPDIEQKDLKTITLVLRQVKRIIKNEKIDLKVNTTLLYNTKIKEEKKRLETRIDGQIELKIKTLDIKKK